MHTALEGEAEMVLIDLVRAKATVVLPAPVAGELLVVDALSGRVLLDVHKAKGAPLSVALPARKMRMQLRPDDARGTVRIGEVDLTWGGAHTLNPQSLTEQPLLAMAEKGAHKDSTPWGAVVQIGPMMSPLGVWGGIDAAISRRAFDTPVFVRARVGALRSESEWTVDDVAWHYVHARAHAALGAEVELILWRVRFSAGADAGIAMVTQNGDRTDAARLKSLGYSIAPVSTLAIGPTMSLDAQVQFPIAWGLSLLGGARTGGVWVPIDDTPTLLPDAMFFVGAGMEW